MPVLAVALALSLGYLCGALPWGLWIGKFARRIDVREHGSRNLGATNVYRVLGPRLGLLTLLLDVSKGALPVWLVPALAPMDAFPEGATGARSRSASPRWPATCGLPSPISAAARAWRPRWACCWRSLPPPSACSSRSSRWCCSPVVTCRWRRC